MFMIFALGIYGQEKRDLITHGLPFKQVVVWGHKLHSHTHSYIHYGFVKAFKYLGYPTYWLDNKDDISTMDFSETLFVTEGQVDQKIPIKNDCFYILHNCKLERYKDLFESGRVIIMQVYTHDVLTRNVKKIDECMYSDIENKTLYMPWATDLLPYEIDAIKSDLPAVKKDFVARFIGTCWGGTYGNIDKIDQFRRACDEYGIPFEITGGWQSCMNIDPERNVDLIKNAYLAPVLVGQWQCENGYIPCRIFKNISYGQFGITNSETVYKLFNKKIVYNPDSYKLFYDAIEYAKNLDIKALYEQMDFVKNKHTYLNRIDTLLWFLKLVFNQSNC
jgi:hypothetical protein